MAKKDKSFSGQFAEAFHDVVVPVLEPMAQDIKDLKGDVETLKEDVKQMQDRLEFVDNKLDRVGRKLDAVTDHQAIRIDDHEKRIRKLERVTKRES